MRPLSTTFVYPALKPMKRSNKNYVSAKAVGAFVPEITRPVFEKFGFQKAALLTDWRTIMGEPLANFTAPERIKWSGSGKGNSGSEDTQSGGTTLIIRVEGPAALEVQHQTPQIIERINRYFGYRAVTDIRILQAPLARDLCSPRKQVDLDKEIENEAEIPIEDERLKVALSRLWRGIQSRKINES